MSGKRYHRVGAWTPLARFADDDMRLVASYLRTSPHRTTEGLFRLPLEYGRADMAWPARRFDAAFARLVDVGFIEHDADAQVVLLLEALELQAPANPNQVKAAVNAIGELPASPLLNRFRERAETLAPSLAEALTERFGQRLAQQTPNTPTPTPTPRTATSTSEVAGRLRSPAQGAPRRSLSRGRGPR